MSTTPPAPRKKSKRRSRLPKKTHFDELKSGGFIRQRQKDLFTIRLRCPGGRVPLTKLAKIIQVARKYGGDYVHLSVRQSIEIPYVDYRDIEPMRVELEKADQKIASCGPRVRVPTACSGCEYNPNGLTDTQEMAAMVDQKFFGHGKFAHKFKISFSGCPIDCARTSEMDLGFQGAVKPVWAKDQCIACGLCISACNEGALKEHRSTGTPAMVKSKCLYCGDCIKVCPTQAWSAAETGWMVRCGGKHGRHPIAGATIAHFAMDKDVPKIIRAILDWYAANGADKGRTRMGAILLQPRVWKSFLKYLRPVMGGKAIANPRPPRKNEIHG